MFNEGLSHEKIQKIHRSREQLDKRKVSIQSRGLSTTLNEYIPSASMPWDHARAYHVLKRLQFGANKNELDTLLSLNPTEFIDQIIDGALNQSLPDPPSWFDVIPPLNGTKEEKDQYKIDNFDRYTNYQLDWLDLMKTHSLREKMVLFWHNHFVTEIGKYEHATLANRYITCLRKHSLGNFKEFTREIGLDDAMLVYLDGIKNRATSPNENYARELLELFTMGIGNYTETDIREIARALTGYTADLENFTAIFSNSLFDNGEKSFLGRTGEFNYDDTIDIIFEERSSEIANFICTKIYKYFVYDIPNQSIIDGLADTFLSNNFEIEPVLRQLLKSEHFFDSEILGAKIKSPVDFILQMQKELGIESLMSLRYIQSYWLYDLEQYILNPINVAGWPEYHSWISTTTLPIRWTISNNLINHEGDEFIIDFRSLANSMSNPNNPYDLAADLARHLISVELIDTDKNELVTILLSGMPDYEWHMNLDDDAIIWRLRNFVGHLFQLPEYQLM